MALIKSATATVYKTIKIAWKNRGATSLHSHMKYSRLDCQCVNQAVKYMSVS